MCSYLPIFLCFLSLLSIWGETTATISVDSSLTAGDKWIWPSPSGDFAFGFQRAPGQSGGYLLAIWYDKILEKTITWSANRDNLAKPGWMVKLTAEGLMLSESRDDQPTILSIGSGGVGYANMLDTGNFVIVDKSGKPIWQSFDNPTDTILPLQTMKVGNKLISRVSNTNYSSGRFNLVMQSDGNFVANTINWPQRSINYGNYFGTPWSYNIGIQLVFNKSGQVYIAGQTGNVLGNVLWSPFYTTEFQYQRAILDYDGVFRMYAYPVSSSPNRPMNWTVLDFVPRNICNQTGNIGGGPCGFNSYCQMGADETPKCSCIPGHSLFDDTDYMRGCKRDFTAQSCYDEPDQFELVEMESTTFQGHVSETFLGMSESECHDSCLSDCLCAAMVFDGNQCWKKGFPLTNGWNGDEVVQKTFIKVGSSNSTTILGRKVRKHQARLFFVGFLGSSIFLSILLLSSAVLANIYCRRKKKETIKVQQDVPGTSMISFSYKELQDATNEFEQVIGQGAFSIVYKGTINLEQGRLFAVKKLHDSVKESQREFEREVKAIARTAHRNLVQLVGFCNEEQHRLLVYEYMNNGSLADILFQNWRPNWSRRVKFALETARGLNYLHEECSTQIIHCDIKPQNILLDDSFTTRISDFGLAKIMKKDQTHTLTGLRGTKGYVAPEWFRSVPITTKVDVYSYGILLLEIICCRRCYVADLEDECQIVLADWAFECCKEGRVDRLVERDHEALADIDKVKRYTMVALCCIQEDPFRRPSMSEVVQMIKGEIEEALPRDLSSYFSSLNIGYNDALSFGIENSFYNTKRHFMKNEEYMQRRILRRTNSTGVLH